MSVPESIRRARNWTALALFGAALIQGTLGYVGWAMNLPNFGWLDWAFSFSGIIYLGLAIAAHWIRFPAALIAGALYAGFLALQLSHGLAALKSGLIFKIPIVMLLLVAVMIAMRHRGTAPHHC